jgi:hypothetical protein
MARKKEQKKFPIDEQYEYLITSGDFAGLTYGECMKIINTAREKKQDIHDAISEYRKRKEKVGQGE